MSFFDTVYTAPAISPTDLSMLTQTLDVWCSLNNIARQEASTEAKILIQTFNSGKTSQVDLINALVDWKH